MNDIKIPFNNINGLKFYQNMPNTPMAFVLNINHEH